MDKARYNAKQTFRNKVVFTELDTLMVMARDAIGKMIGTSAQFVGVDWADVSQLDERLCEGRETHPMQSPTQMVAKRAASTDCDPTRPEVRIIPLTVCLPKTTPTTYPDVGKEEIEHDTKNAVAGSVAYTRGHRRTIFTLPSDNEGCRHLEGIAAIRERPQPATIRTVPRSRTAFGVFRRPLATSTLLATSAGNSVDKK